MGCYMNITILCKVVDNFGDIGVVYRMAKRLLEMEKEGDISKKLTLNIVVDNLAAFSQIHSSVKENMSFQCVDNMNIYNWNDYDYCYNAFSAGDGELFGVVLECFQCGRPDWMEKILFEDKLQRTVHIIMIDYLTAEKYAEDFHLLDSLTRSAKVQKVNFMPGFTDKTGGLVIGNEWQHWIEKGSRNKAGPAFVFTYDRNWNSLAGALKEAGIKAVVAQGKGKESFIQSCNASGYKNYQELPFVNQEEWDKEMENASVLFIRGEESMSRACLSGIPFVWHAYPQSDEYQLVKVNALLDRMERHFNSKDFEIIRQVWLDFNSPESEVNEEDFHVHCRNFVESIDKTAYGFEDFARSLLKNGDLCNNLMTFINKKGIL